MSKMQCGSGRVSTANRHFKILKLPFQKICRREQVRDENEEELIMENTQVLLNIVWTMVGAFLVYFMQAGFAMVETGFTRAKNSGNILMKNMMDFVLGSIFFFIIGFALMFGGSNAFIGTAGFFHPKSLADADGMFNGLPIGVFMIFQTVFCATSATIVSGARQREPNSSLI